MIVGGNVVVICTVCNKPVDGEPSEYVFIKVVNGKQVAKGHKECVYPTGK